MAYRKIFIAIALLLLVAPRLAAVQVSSGVIDGFKATIKSKQLLDKVQPTVPIDDKKQGTREFLNGLAIDIAKRIINGMVNSTIDWANSGFEGSPAYAVDKSSYFLNSANGIVGDYINNSQKLGFLCSPFQKNVVASLRYTYRTNMQNQFQCTVTGVIGNLEDYYHNFSNGGWDAWFSISQNPTNNPYGAYLAATVDINQQVAKTLKLEEMELNWGNGFLSAKYCLKGSDGKPDRDPKTGECRHWGTTKTPGTLIQDGIKTHINAEFAQLMDVEKFDQLLGALMNGLLQRKIFSKDPDKGFFNDNYKTDESPYGGETLSDGDNSDNSGGDGGGTGLGPQNEFLSCSASPFTANTNPDFAKATPITWTLENRLENILPGVQAEFVWTLDPDAVVMNRTDTSITVVYTEPGTKQGHLVANRADGLKDQLTYTDCSNSVSIFPETEE